jgi:hypothetical protein
VRPRQDRAGTLDVGRSPEGVMNHLLFVVMTLVAAALIATPLWLGARRRRQRDG